MIRLVVTFLCLSFFVACAARPKLQEVDVESELKKNSNEFTERHPASAGPISTPIVEKKSSIQKPSVMVLPAGTKNLNQSQEVLNRDALSRAAANAINGYLTEKRYPVKSIEETSRLNEAIALQGDISNQDEDLSYIASLSFGADVYIKFTSDIHRGQILANLSAYESTSGRMLGTQTATVNDNGTRKEELVASAMHKAMPGLERKILAYFEEDSKIGVPYKVILKLNRDDEEVLYNRASRLLKQRFAKVLTNAMTKKTADFTVYVKSEECADVYEVYEAIRQTLGTSFAVKKDNLVQKLLILELD